MRDKQYILYKQYNKKKDASLVTRNTKNLQNLKAKFYKIINKINFFLIVIR